MYVPLPSEVAKSLRETPALGNTPNPRFFFRSENCTEEMALGRWHDCFRSLFLLADIRRADGTPKRCHSHMLRDTFAIENLLAGVPLDQVSILLGHASIKTTERHYALGFVLVRNNWSRALRKRMRFKV